MKTSILSVAIASLLALASGCQKDGSSAVNTVGLTGNYSGAGDTWSVGVQIIFKEAPPADVVAKLEAGGAVAVRSLPFTWIIAKYDRFSTVQNTAIEASLRAGSVLKGTPNN